MLHAPRSFNRETRSHQDEKQKDDPNYQNLHSHRVADRLLRVCRMKCGGQSLKKRVDRPAKDLVEERSKPQLFVHRLWLSWKLEPAPQRSVKGVHGFNENGAYRQKQARKEAVNAVSRTSEYTIGANRDQNVTQQKSDDHACG